MIGKNQPAPGGHREAGQDHDSRRKYSPPWTIGDHVQDFYARVAACDGCHGPILPFDRHGMLCGTCASWVTGEILTREIALANASRVRRLRVVTARRALIDLALAAVRADLFDYPEVA